jgi:hypothetical protein
MHAAASGDTDAHENSAASGHGLASPSEATFVEQRAIVSVAKESTIGMRKRSGFIATT